VDSGTGVFNGDMGVITLINNHTNYIEVRFDDNRYVTYDTKQAEELELAYAVTIHKSQGSEYPAVIIPLVSGTSMLMTRNLLYTGVTRAKSCVCIVGRKEMFQSMIHNEDQHKRYSGLKWQIVNY
jgi:exodeoxyribonuclease V alpha subunit